MESWDAEAKSSFQERAHKHVNIISSETYRTADLYQIKYGQFWKEYGWSSQDLCFIAMSVASMPTKSIYLSGVKNERPSNQDSGIPTVLIIWGLVRPFWLN